MKTDKRRTIVGRFLLTLYLAMLAAGAFHVHEHVEDDFVCLDCINHIDHAGHISVGHVAMGDCLLCRFFTISYIGVQCMVMILASIVLASFFAERTLKVFRRAGCTISLRAPPVFLVKS